MRMSLSRFFNWYFGKSALPYWCIVVFDLVVCFFSGLFIYRHLPNKKKVENRGLLNWWKYNQRLIKQGKLAVERVQLLSELSKMRILK